MRICNIILYKKLDLLKEYIFRIFFRMNISKGDVTKFTKFE